jgi:hypothetical protein
MISFYSDAQNNFPVFIAPGYLFPLSEEPANGSHSDKDEYNPQSATMFM